MSALVVLFLVFRLLVGLASIPPTAPSQRTLTPEREFSGQYGEDLIACARAIVTNDLEDNKICQDNQVYERCLAEVGEHSTFCERLTVSLSSIGKSEDSITLGEGIPLSGE